MRASARGWLLLMLGWGLLAGGCGDETSSSQATADVASTADVPSPADAVTPDAAIPDATPDAPVTAAEWPDGGDEAWVARAMPLLLGRKVSGIRELRVLADLVAQTDRATVARAIMSDPAFVDRWTDALMDHLQIARVGDWMNRECMAAPLLPGDAGELARHIRDHGPLEPYPAGPSNLLDVFRSALRLDDVSVIYRAHLFTMLSRSDPCINPTPLERERAKRNFQGEKFNRSYTNRSFECAACHNSEFSTTNSDDPASDRFWDIPGRFEKALWGTSYGRDHEEVFAVFRHLGVVAFSDRDTAYPPEQDLVEPWGMDPACGRFIDPQLIEPDPVDVDAYFLGERSDRTSVWEVEAELRAGVAGLRADGLDYGGDSGLELIPGEAFAYLVANSIVNRVWEQAFGSQLTLAHHFPRNQMQRDRLLSLSDHFIETGWSLRTLLADIVTDPVFNPQTPGQVDAGHPYPWAPLFEPFSTEEEDADMRGNGPGDGVHRARARVLLSMLANALGWPQAARFPELVETVWQKSQGVYLLYLAPGFEGIPMDGLLAWEARTALCRQRKFDPRSFDPTAGDAAASCVGHCGSLSPDYCFCDGPCQLHGDCCADYSAACAGDEGALPDSFETDWIDGVLDHIAINTSLKVRDVAVALKDRLITEPDLVDGEEALIANLFGVSTVDVKATTTPALEEGMRRYCGVLAKTPQFMLVGLAAAPQKTTPPLFGPPARDLCAAWKGRVEAVGAGAVSCDRW